MTRVAELLRTAGVELDGVLLLPPPPGPSPSCRPATAASPRRGCCCDAAAALGLDLARELDDRRRRQRRDRRPRAPGCRTVLVEHPRHRAPSRAAPSQPDAHAPPICAARGGADPRADGPARRRCSTTSTSRSSPTAPTSTASSALAADPRIRGFTTNPTLMRKAGLTDYADVRQRLLERITDRPISFEVFADDAAEMRRQARVIAAWGENVYVKIPVTNTARRVAGRRSCASSREDGVQVNVTALFTPAQVERDHRGRRRRRAQLRVGVRRADRRRRASTRCRSWRESVEIMRDAPRSELIWASPREMLNVVQADAIGCHIITMTQRPAGQARIARQGPRRSSRSRRCRCSIATP